MTRNLARQWLELEKSTTADYDGQCLDLADDVGKWLSNRSNTILFGLPDMMDQTYMPIIRGRIMFGATM